jgi:hypothetical protein
MISIRISDQDYRKIKSRCGERGATNVSQFVRAATVSALDLPEALSSPAFISLQLAGVRRRLDRLDEQVIALAERMDTA